MGIARLGEVLSKNSKDLVTAITFYVKEIGGSYARRPVEEIYEVGEAFFRANKAYLLENNFQPLVDFADTIARRRSVERFRLHELMRAGLSFKHALYPLLFQAAWEAPSELEECLRRVDDATDRFVVNMAQAFIHYAKDSLAKDPLEFPVWVALPGPLNS